MASKQKSSSKEELEASAKSTPLLKPLLPPKQKPLPKKRTRQTDNDSEGLSDQDDSEYVKQSAKQPVPPLSKASKRDGKTKDTPVPPFHDQSGDGNTEVDEKGNDGGDEEPTFQITQGEFDSLLMKEMSKLFEAERKLSSLRNVPSATPEPKRRRSTITPFEFDGKGDVTAWLKRFNDHARCDGLNETEKLELVDVYLSAPLASRWTAEKAKFQTWASAQEWFLSTFGALRTPYQQWGYMQQKLSQGASESVFDYQSRVEEICNRWDALTPEQRKVAVYQHGIFSPEIRAAVAKLKTWDECTRLHVEMTGPQLQSGPTSMTTSGSSGHGGMVDTSPGFVHNAANSGAILGPTGVNAISVGRSPYHGSSDQGYRRHDPSDERHYELLAELGRLRSEQQQRRKLDSRRGKDGPPQPRTEKQRCYFCSKTGHTIQDCELRKVLLHQAETLTKSAEGKGKGNGKGSKKHQPQREQQEDVSKGMYTSRGFS